MRARIFLVILFLLTSPFLSCYAQDLIIVRGEVTDTQGKPLKELLIKTPQGIEYHLKNVGQFEILVPSNCRYLTFHSPLYYDFKKEIGESFLEVVMIYEGDEVYQQKKKEEELERMRVEQEQKTAEKKAEQERKAAEKKAEQERKAAEAKANKEARGLVREEKNAVYDSLYRNRGIEHSVDISYSYPLLKCDVMYAYSGYREYGNLHPFELDYTLSYRINRLISIGGGFGGLIHAKSITIVNDSFSSVYGDFKEKRFDIPVFASFRLTPCRSRVRPMVGGAIGYCFFSKTLFWEGNLGADIRMTQRLSAHFCLSVRSTPYPYFKEVEGTAGYEAAISPAFKVGFSF